MQPTSDPTPTGPNPGPGPPFPPFFGNPGVPTFPSAAPSASPSAAPVCLQECVDAVFDACVSNTPGDDGTFPNCDVSPAEEEGEGGEGGEVVRFLLKSIDDLRVSEDDILSKSLDEQINYRETLVMLYHDLLALMDS